MIPLSPLEAPFGQASCLNNRPPRDPPVPPSGPNRTGLLSQQTDPLGIPLSPPSGTYRTGLLPQQTDPLGMIPLSPLEAPFGQASCLNRQTPRDPPAPLEAPFGQASCLNRQTPSGSPSLP
ncbi:hypothetical protein JTE90_023553 [Oedothorax gibbosus]|uniref:Uncharacterized protein n=1 Tax=Oedothorax gibbosus TaxID=931172 RepID=A0AAV6TT47_9ARAC|nr:hypothetical protein JTE90_023553 [Oedothorax gibbosus]